MNANENENAFAAVAVNNHRQMMTRSNNLVEMINSFIQRLIAKEEPLQNFIDEASNLDVNIRNFIEELGDDRENWYFWRMINEPMPNFFNMDLSEILAILLDEGNWPHPDMEEGEIHVVNNHPVIEIPPLDIDALLAFDNNNNAHPPGGEPDY